MMVMEKAMSKSTWSREELLQVWGLRIGGASLGNPVRLFNRGERLGDVSGLDDEMQALMFVESTQGFLLSRPILRHVYCEYQPVHTFRLLLPGEGLQEALMRLGWLQVADWDHPSRLPHVVLDNFRATLDDRIRKTPFSPIPPEIKETGIEIGDRISAGKN
jgi:hypothetical protein